MSEPGFTPFAAADPEQPAFRAWPERGTFGTCADTVDEFARGFAEGQQLAETAIAQERSALHALLASAQALQPAEPQAVRSLILETVERLVSEIVGRTPVDRDWLVEQVERAAQVAGRIEDRKILWLHPDDIAMLQGAGVEAELRADESLVRGSLRLELESGWIEHGRMVMLDAMRASLAVGGEGK
jgi:flagellar assembly protein FliH